jgi:hypothetical protein
VLRTAGLGKLLNQSFSGERITNAHLGVAKLDILPTSAVMSEGHLAIIATDHLTFGLGKSDQVQA